MISSSQGLWRLPSRDRGERDPERGKPDQATDPHHPAGHREAPPLGSHLYLIFFVCICNKFFNRTLSPIILRVVLQRFFVCGK